MFKDQFVSPRDDSFFHDAEIETRAAGGDDQFDQLAPPVARGERAARLARLAYPHQGGAQPEEIANAHGVLVQVRDGEVFTEGAGASLDPRTFSQ